MKGVTIHTNTPEEIAEELKRNFEDHDSARLLIMGTKYPDGYRMRFGCKNPANVVGVLIHQAMNTGRADEALALARELIKMGTAAKDMIEAELARKAANN